jgi:hypothetical protein
LESGAAEELILGPNPDAGEVPKYSDATVTRIIDITHRHPFLIQAICSEIINIANRDQLQKIELGIVDEAIKRVFATYELFFRNILDDAGEHGRKILALLATGPNKLTDEYKNSGDLQGLIQRHVVQQNTDGGYQVEIPLVEFWLSQQL